MAKGHYRDIGYDRTGQEARGGGRAREPGDSAPAPEASRQARSKA